MRTANYIKAIGDGRESAALFSALSKVEAEQKKVNQQLIQADQEIEMATVKRPTAKQVQEAWSEIEELWEDVPEDERQELLASFVTQVEVKQKDRASMKLLPIPEGHGLKFVTRSQYRAGRLVVANYPPIQFPDFEVTRIPREAPKPSNLSQVQ